MNSKTRKFDLVICIYMNGSVSVYGSGCAPENILMINVYLCLKVLVLVHI